MANAGLTATTPENEQRNLVNGTAALPNGNATKAHDDTTPTMPPPLTRPNRFVQKLEMGETQQIYSMAPRDGMAYSKTTQTDDERVSVGEFSMGSQEFDDDEFSMGEKLDINFDESPSNEIAKLLPHLGMRGLQDHRIEEPEPEERIPELSEEEKRQILQSDEFQSFFSKAGKVLERELAELVSPSEFFVNLTYQGYIFR